MKKVIASESIILNRGRSLVASLKSTLINDALFAGEWTVLY